MSTVDPADDDELRRQAIRRADAKLGFGLVAHGVSVYAFSPTLREDMIAREMERLRGGRR